MRQISATFRIAFGLACILSCVLMAARWLDMIPDKRVEMFRGRRDLCEAIAINCSLLAMQNDVATIDASLQAIDKRNADILSIAVRKSDGELMTEIGDHSSHWKAKQQVSESQVLVPVYSGRSRWGQVEIRFAAMPEGPLSSISTDPVSIFTAFVLSAAVLAFYLYLKTVLKQLNPSNVVPARVRSAFDSLAEGLIIVDQNEQIVLANEAFAKTSGQDVESLIGQKASSLPWLTTGSVNSAGAFPWRDVLKEGTQQSGKTLELESEGDRRTFMINATPIMDERGKQKGALTSFEDITPLQKKQSELRSMVTRLQDSSEEINRQNEELKRLATVDPLTNCLNRRSFFELFDNCWSKALETNTSLSAFMVDIDHFKLINDNHGHSTGDEVLVRVGKVLRDCAREEDIVCRYGGEEFSVLLPATDIETACQVAELIRKELEAQEFPQLSITASLGVSSIECGAPDPQHMLDQADKCLYVAKRNGRNQVVRIDQVPEDLVVDESKISREKEADNHQSSATSIPFQAVTALISALSYRDQMTGAHSRRVADLAVACGEGLLSISECYTLEIAALLHDIGKVGVPDAILLKPGPLTVEEWGVMEKHDRIGIEIIRASFSCSELTEIVENHHAFYGLSRNGLPSGEEIPVGARILAIADAYDAIVSDRVYRKGRSPKEAYEELRRCKGTQFDPELVERFIDVMQTRNMSSVASNTIVSKESALRIGLQLERLAETLDSQDLEGLNALVGRLHQTATQDDITELADQAQKLQEKILSDSDLLEIFSAANEMMQFCRETQKTYLAEASSSNSVPDSPVGV